MDEHLLSYFREKRILVTGASGYLATRLAAALKNVDCTLIRLSRSQSLASINSEAQVIDRCGDIRSKGIWEETLQDVDIVYHFAAQTSVYVAKDDPYADFQTNVLPMLNMLETCRNRDLKPVILFSGTVTQAGMAESLPVDETCQDMPITIYDMHKMMAEKYLEYYCRREIVRGATLRLANVYGPGPSGNADRGVLNKMILKALAGEELTIYGKGDYLRDYIYIDDVVTAFLTAPRNIDTLNGKHYVIASGHGYTVAQAVNLVADQAALRNQRRVEIKHVKPPSEMSPIESRNFIADTGLFERATGWRSEHNLADGITKMMDEVV